MIEVIGKNVEEAIAKGLKELKLTKENVKIEIISNGGFLKKAKVRLTEIVKNEAKKTEKIEKKDENFAKTNQKINEEQFTSKSSFGSERILDEQKNNKNLQNPEKTNSKCDEKLKSDDDIYEKNIKVATKFLEELLKKMKINAKITQKVNEKAIILQINSDDDKTLIGPHGETMNALQVLVNGFMIKGSKLGKKLLIDVGNYRENQEELLKEKTKKAIEKCLQTAKPVSMDYMNSYERFIVHEVIMNDGRVVSESFGKEPRRFVKIFIK